MPGDELSVTPPTAAVAAAKPGGRRRDTTMHIIRAQAVNSDEQHQQLSIEEIEKLSHISQAIIAKGVAAGQARDADACTFAYWPLQKGLSCT